MAHALLCNWRWFKRIGSQLAMQGHPNPKSGASANSATFAQWMINSLQHVA
jgi:hypothetical protein